MSAPTVLAASAIGVTPSMSNLDAATNNAGYWLPEEADPHERTFMQWPVSRAVHPDPVFLDMLQKAIADIANTVVAFEPVVMLMDKRFEAGARQKLGQSVEIWNIPTEDLWCRDSGPVFVVDGKGGLAVSELNFNGWGNKQVHQSDGKIARRVANRMKLAVFDNGVVGEGGGVESDGHGTLMAHESSWVNSNRNDQRRDEIEAKLLEALGGEAMIWAPGVKGKDITDYHIDALARFVAPGKVLIQMSDQVYANDPWSAAAFQTRDILVDAIDARGKKLELISIPAPVKPRVTSVDFVASYVNYYVCNGAVVLAEFGDTDSDEEAARVISRLYPNREIVTLNVDPVGEVGGGIHCATREQPVV